MSPGDRLGSRMLLALLAAAPLLASCSDRSDERSQHKNTEYSIGGRTVRLVDGVAETAAAPGSAASTVTRYFGNEAWGDLNGDGREDVVFLLTEETGGSGTFYYAVVALDLERGFEGSQAVLLGDRVAPQQTEVQPNGAIVVTYADRAPGESFASPPSVAKSIRLVFDSATLQLAEVVQDFEGESRPGRYSRELRAMPLRRAASSSFSSRATPAP